MKHYILLALALVLVTIAKSQTVSPPTARGPQYGFDVYPVFPKNDGDFSTYVANHVSPPESVIDQLQETITIHFNVDSTGKASIAKVFGNKSPELAAEFDKAVSKSPLWKPATLNGKPVNSTITAMFG